MKGELFNDMIVNVQVLDDIAQGKTAARDTAFPEPGARHIREKDRSESELQLD